MKDGLARPGRERGSMYLGLPLHTNIHSYLSSHITNCTNKYMALQCIVNIRHWWGLEAIFSFRHLKGERVMLAIEGKGLENEVL